MATITPTITKTNPDQMVVKWGPFLKTDSCVPVEVGSFSDKSVQVEGTPDGGTAILQGSNDATNIADGTYRTLQDHSDNALSWTAFGIIDSVGPNTRWIKPSVSGGTAPSVTVTLFCRRPA